MNFDIDVTPRCVKFHPTDIHSNWYIEQVGKVFCVNQCSKSQTWQKTVARFDNLRDTLDFCSTLNGTYCDDKVPIDCVGAKL